MKPFQKRNLREISEKKIRKFSFSQNKKIGKIAKMAKFLRFFKSEKRTEKSSLGKKIFWFLVAAGGVGFLALGILFLIVLKDLPDINNLQKLTFAESTAILARDGTPLYSVHGDQNRKIVPLDEIPKSMILAILAAEDDQFYSHPGFDVGGIAKAFCFKLTRLCPPRGGSTLTQQIVKNIFLTPERTITRKLRELVLAYKIEQKLSKDQILELYLNGISFGSNFFGVEMASRAYFGKSVRDISVAESAILAALPKKPSYYSPFGENAFSRVVVPKKQIDEKNLDTFEKIDHLPGISWKPGLVGKKIELAGGKWAYFPGRADWVLKRMRELGFLSENDFLAAKKELENFHFAKYREEITAPHFVFLVKEKLEKKFGAEMVEHGGLKVTTTLNPEFQKMAETAIADNRERNETRYGAENAALVALDPDTGEILSLVGSADFWDDEIDGKLNIITARRQPGSTFKPIAFTAAFEKGILSPASVLFDVKTVFGTIGGKKWIPKNFDGAFSGPVSVRHALGYSLNTIAIKAAILVGPKNVFAFAQKLGINLDGQESKKDESGIAIGTLDVRPLDMAAAYSVFANGGKKVSPVAILKVEDRFGNLLFQWEKPEPEEILKPEIAFLIDDILADFDARNPLWASLIQIPDRKNIAKTGTTNDQKTGLPRDAWTIGGTRNLIVAVWTGNNYPEKKPLKKTASGASTAAPIWKKFMTAATKNLPKRDFSAPPKIARVLVSAFSGKLPTPDTPKNLITEEVFAEEFVPTEFDESLKFTEIDRVSGKLPTDQTPPKAIQKVAILNFHAFDPTREKWEEAVQKWVAENAADFLKEKGITREILPKMPTEYDDIHTPETAAQKPKIEFLRPKNGDGVAPPKITVALDISAKNGLDGVRFLWNGKPTFSQKNGENFIVKIPKNAAGKNLLTAIATDRLFYESEKSVEIFIEKDNFPPEISLLTPKKVRGGRAVKIAARVVDRGGAVKKVEFFADGKKIGIDLFPPFEIFWTPKNIAKMVEISAVATDFSGNFQKATAEISVEKSGFSKTFEILKPKNAGVQKVGENLFFEIAIPPKMFQNFEKITLFGKRFSDENFQKFADFSEKSRFGFLGKAVEIPAKSGEKWQFFAENADGQKTPEIVVFFQK